VFAYDPRYHTRRPSNRVTRNRTLAVVGAAVLTFVAGSFVGHWDAAAHPNWKCSAEDEVVIIGDQCAHIDTLTRP
jgi:hypothetical protein